jgi:hypothetical protein
MKGESINLFLAIRQQTLIPAATTSASQRIVLVISRPIRDIVSFQWDNGPARMISNQVDAPIHFARRQHMNSATSLQSNTVPASFSMRWEAWLLVITFFLWVVTFLSLAPNLGAGGPPPIPQTAAEAVQQYEGKGGGNLVVVALGAIAMLTGIIPLIRLGLQMRASGGNPFATLGLIAAIAAMGLLVFHSYLRASLPFVVPPNFPPLLDRVELYATNPISTIAMIVWTIALVFTGIYLARLGILKRTGWTVAAVGTILAVLMVVANFGIPFVPALLSVSLGVGLLRRKA